MVNSGVDLPWWLWLTKEYQALTDVSRIHWLIFSRWMTFQVFSKFKTQVKYSWVDWRVKNSQNKIQNAIALCHIFVNKVIHSLSWLWLWPQNARKPSGNLDYFQQAVSWQPMLCERGPMSSRSVIPFPIVLLFSSVSFQMCSFYTLLVTPIVGKIAVDTLFSTTSLKLTLYCDQWISWRFCATSGSGAQLRRQVVNKIRPDKAADSGELPDSHPTFKIMILILDSKF